MSTPTLPPRPDDERLSAWLDGELDASARAEVDAWLQAHPEDAAQLRLWAADRDALRARLGPVADEPLPPALLQAVQQGGRAAAAVPPMARWRQAAMVAGLLVTGALAGGWIGASAVSGDGVSLAALARGPFGAVRASGWPHRAAVAHAVYAPELRHPVEVNVAQGSAAEQRAQEEHLQRWLTKRLDMPVRLFDLRPQGYALVGGRLLPDAAGPSAQLMYQNGGGQRITVYLRKPEPGSSAAFRYQRDGELGMFYWVDEGFGCALVGKLPREQLLALSEAVYQQAEAEAEAHPRPAAARPVF